jgi:crotonobetainyl-CoA:carnitine CoA-transferase CaiB-like acyl-CoA transferase
MGGTAMMAWGLVCGLLHAGRTSEGQVIDAAIVDGTAYLASFARSFYQAGHLSDERGERWMDGAAPWNRTYVCGDGGYVTVCAVEAKFYQVLLQLLELEETPEFSGCEQWDKSRWPAQVAKLQSVFLSRSRDDWCELLGGTDACFAPVLTYSEAPHHPHSQARNAYQQVDGEWYPQPAPRFSKTIPEPAWEEGEQPGPVA